MGPGTDQGREGSAGLRHAASLFLVSFLALYLEISLIRWIPAMVRIVGFFTNLVLISAFLGLGLGCAAHSLSRGPGKQRLHTPARLLLSFLVYALIMKLGISIPVIWGEKFWISPDGVVPPIIIPEIVFALNTWAFLPVGRMLGKTLERFRPLAGYSINLAGSVAGVAAFTIISLLEVPPLYWFAGAAITFLVCVGLEGAGRRRLVTSVVVWAAMLAVVFIYSRDSIWSPYYKITLNHKAESFQEHGLDPAAAKSLGLVVLEVNHDFFQFGANLDPIVIKSSLRGQPHTQEEFMMTSQYWEAPYKVRPPGRVLILGAGVGNDVASALRNGAVSVDAVEIDPTIIRLGRELHPENPYGDARVTVHNNDARRFMKYDDGRYDLIVFTFLDSHALFSAFSSIRLDNFVYTRESFRDAARLLSPQGAIVILFATPRDFVATRLFYLVDEIFPDSTRAWAWQGELWLPIKDYDIIAGGPALKTFKPELPNFAETTDHYIKDPARVIPTDDWPFLYLVSRYITPGYALTLPLLLVIAVIFTRRVIPRARGLRVHFFLLGAGFLLLETKSITELSLLFGSTWVVNSTVIVAFLGMALLANLIAAKIEFKAPGWAYWALGAAVAVALFVPARGWILPGTFESAVVSGLIVALPVLFSGLIFAASFKKTENPALALGSNMLGAVAGGMVEYVSLVTGFKALYLLVILVYLGAWLSRKR